MLNRSFGPGPLSRSSTKDKSDVYHTTQSDMNSSNTSSGRRTLQRSQSGCTEETLGSTPAIAPVAIEWSHIYHMTIQWDSHVGSNQGVVLNPGRRHGTEIRATGADSHPRPPAATPGIVQSSPV
eukprot:scpid106604/ scgid7000/ 